jgi:hypothetical protein
MTEAFGAEVAEITSLVKAAALPSDIEDTVVWCLKQLPAKYDQFCATYESRDAEEILRLEQGVLEKLIELPSSHRDRPPLREAVLQHLRLLNERYSLPGLVPKPPVPHGSVQEKKQVNGGKGCPSHIMQHRRASVQQVSCALSGSRRMNESQENPPRKGI